LGYVFIASQEKSNPAYGATHWL